MMIARWHVAARFGHKQKVIELLKRWDRDIGAKAGIDPGKQRIATGSVGAREAEIQMDLEIGSLAELGTIFEKFAKVPGHDDWGRELEPLIISGSTYWEVLRTVD